MATVSVLKITAFQLKTGHIAKNAAAHKVRKFLLHTRYFLLHILCRKAHYFRPCWSDSSYRSGAPQSYGERAAAIDESAFCTQIILISSERATHSAGGTQMKAVGRACVRRLYMGAIAPRPKAKGVTCPQALICGDSL